MKDANTTTSEKAEPPVVCIQCGLVCTHISQLKDGRCALCWSGEAKRWQDSYNRLFEKVRRYL